MAKNKIKKINRQTMVDIILHKKLKLEQHEPTPRKVREWTQSAPERWAVPVAIVTQIVLLKATLVFGNTFQMFGIFSWLINVWSYSMMAILCLINRQAKQNSRYKYISSIIINIFDWLVFPNTTFGHSWVLSWRPGLE